MAKHLETGALGENIISDLMIKKGFLILKKNYRKKCGEIDLIVLAKNKIHFVEVKTFTIRKNFGKDFYRPEDNIHERKLKRIARTVQVYLLETGWQGDWTFDCAMLYLNESQIPVRLEYLADQLLI